MKTILKNVVFGAVIFAACPLMVACILLFAKGSDSHWLSKMPIAALCGALAGSIIGTLELLENNSKNLDE